MQKIGLNAKYADQSWRPDEPYLYRNYFLPVGYHNWYNNRHMDDHKRDILQRGLFMTAINKLIEYMENRIKSIYLDIEERAVTAEILDKARSLAKEEQEEKPKAPASLVEALNKEMGNCQCITCQKTRTIIQSYTAQEEKPAVGKFCCNCKDDTCALQGNTKVIGGCTVHKSTPDKPAANADMVQDLRELVRLRSISSEKVTGKIYVVFSHEVEEVLSKYRSVKASADMGKEYDRVCRRCENLEAEVIRLSAKAPADEGFVIRVSDCKYSKSYGCTSGYSPVNPIIYRHKASDKGVK